MRTLLVLENDYLIPPSIERFIRFFEEGNKDCKVIQLNNLKCREKIEIISAFSEATDIVVMTQFVQGSDYQLYEFSKLLAKMESKNFFIQNSDIKESFEKNLDDKDIYDIRHHNVYQIYGYHEPPKLITFPEAIKRHEDFLAEEKRIADELSKNKEEAKQKPTGIKIRILACNTGGKEFSALKIGSVVDTLDCSSFDPNPNCSSFDPNPKRGVWIWGVTEPIKLVNDCGLQEYEIVTSNLSFSDKLDLSFKHAGIDFNEYSEIELRGLLSIYEDPDLSSLEKAQEFCDFVNIERRGNRRIIADLIEK